MPNPLTLTPRTPGSLTLTAKGAGSFAPLVPKTGLRPHAGLYPSSNQGPGIEPVNVLTLTPRS